MTTPSAPRQRRLAALAPIPLAEFLATEDAETTYRISALLPTGGRALLAAQYKSGKTTAVLNLVRSLADGDDFLDRFPVQPARVTLLDDEMDPSQLRRWLRAQRIRRPEVVKIASLRGSLSAFDIMRADVRAHWAAALRGTTVLILDCLRPVLDALGLDENRDAGRFLVAFDALIKDANISEAVVVHHMGHVGERSRGDSRLRDWPDVEWRLVRKSEEPHSPRFFTAYGRDVDVPELAVLYDGESRRLTASQGNRFDAEAEAAITAILAVIEASGGGMSRNRIEVALKVHHPQKVVRHGLDLALERAVIIESAGPRGARMCRIADEVAAPRPTSSAPRQRSQLDLVTSLIEDEVEVEHEDQVTSSTKKCRICGFRMDSALAAAGFAVHPNCENDGAA